MPIKLICLIISGLLSFLIAQILVIYNKYVNTLALGVVNYEACKIKAESSSIKLLSYNHYLMEGPPISITIEKLKLFANINILH